MKNILKVIFVLIGGFIGAGFASGQEVLVFFSRYGLGGYYGIFLSASIFAITIYKVFSICLKYNIDNYEDFLYELNFLYSKKHAIIKIFKFIVNSFLLVSFYIMVAGFSSFFYTSFGIPIKLSNFILCFICYFLFNKNIDSLINISVVLIPVSILFIFFIGVKQITSIPMQLEIYNGWFISSLLYVSYNSILLIPLSVSLKNYFTNKQNIIICSILIGIIIAVLSCTLFIILIDYIPNNVDLPMLDITNNINYLYKNLYGLVIIFSIITTLLSSGFTFINNMKYAALKKKSIIFIMCASSLFVSNFGFSNLINALYPIFGYLGFLQIFLILLK